MSIKRRIEKLEQKGKAEQASVVFYEILDEGLEIGEDGGLISGKVVKSTGKGDITLSVDEFDKDMEKERRAGNTIIIDDLFTRVNTEKLRTIVDRSKDS